MTRAALSAVLALGHGGEPFSQQAILNPSGFTGIDGLFRFTPNGLVQRSLAVLEVVPQATPVVSPAPQSFQDVGYLASGHRPVGGRATKTYAKTLC